ncbi:Putative myosin [Podospora comata]|uniref:Myosin n=1 Tax=Podospora comata TaxID=48703 RepID=A0ABY6RVY7_PODCO|nr:Putative myosin [Podospora comata]
MYTTMAAPNAHRFSFEEGGHTPTTFSHPPPQSPEPERHEHRRLSDTSSASSRVQSPRSAISPPGPSETSDQQLPKQPLPSPRGGRSLSLAQIAGPIKRKPLSLTASPLATRYSSPRLPELYEDLQRPEQRFARSVSLDSPTLYEFPGQSNLASSSLRVVERAPSLDSSRHLSSPAAQEDGAEEDVQLRNIIERNPAASQTPHAHAHEPSGRLSARTVSVASQESDYDQFEYTHLYSPGLEQEAEGKPATHVNTNTKAMSFISRKQPPPHLDLGSPIESVPESPVRTARDSNLNKPLPKSPASSKLGAFFGWAASPSRSSVTEFSDDRALSPASQNPVTVVTESEPYDVPLSPKSPSAYSNDDLHSPAIQYCESYLQTPADSTTSLVQIEEMEDELKAIGAELAASIRREMDLEDLVDRMQEQVNSAQVPGRRTSDYFSDSGYSSARFSEYDHAKEEVSQVQRRAEQERAQLRLELTTKLQEERTMRRLLDQQIQELQQKASEVDVAQLGNAEASDRVKELEATCEDLTRRLAEEKESKSNFEDLLAALKSELQTASNERDNLRDEIVPQLRMRVEGLEAEAAENARLAYDTSKMQQELETLRSQTAETSKMQQEIESLRSRDADTSRLQQEVEILRSQTADASQMRREIEALRSLNSETSKMQQELEALRSQNVELKQTGTRMSMALSRSASVTAGSLKNKNRPVSLSRSNSTRPGPASTEPREVLADRLKDVEAQRDALHSALRSLLERQELQNRENAKRIRQLEMERDRLLTASPKKAGYERDVSNLREEINVLRRRAEEAIEQKWQVEKGLGGLKMDLDRAEEEIATLRILLRENDILVPESLLRASGSHEERVAPVTSASLEKAYKDLQDAYAEALERIKQLEESAGSDERVQFAIQRLEQSLSTAVSERDDARSEASSFKTRLENMEASEKWQVEKGLGGLKMDLDRAEEEIATLRILLRENDILVPESLLRASGSHEERVAPVTSASLEKAYKDLQDAYAEALERIKQLEESAGSDERVQFAIQRLEQSLSTAVSERDDARSEASSFKTRLENMEASEKQQFGVEQDLADQLQESARRVEELAQQVRSQLDVNAALRSRLATTIARGEAEQRLSTERIAGMQSRLRALEEQVVHAQTGAEERVARHEEELAMLKDAHSHQLQRIRDNAGILRSPRHFPSKSPLSPMFSLRSVSSPNNLKSPRMSTPLLSPYGTARPDIRRSANSLDGSDGTITQQVEVLKGRVAELEGALAAADAEMQEVVGRMNIAQIEVMNLQEQREEAVRETRRLQRVIEEERMRVFEERFRGLSTEVR